MSKNQWLIRGAAATLLATGCAFLWNSASAQTDTPPPPPPPEQQAAPAPEDQADARPYHGRRGGDEGQGLRLGPRDGSGPRGESGECDKGEFAPGNAERNRPHDGRGPGQGYGMGPRDGHGPGQGYGMGPRDGHGPGQGYGMGPRDGHGPGQGYGMGPRDGHGPGQGYGMGPHDGRGPGGEFGEGRGRGIGPRDGSGPGGGFGGPPPPPRFEDLDTDGDGVVSKGEFEAAPRPPHPPMRGGFGRGEGPRQDGGGPRR